MRYLRVSGFVASATCTCEASDRSATSCMPAGVVSSSRCLAAPAISSTAAVTESFSVLMTRSYIAGSAISTS
jgi:hypothetical protein